MNWKKIFAVVRREYVERIRTKAFWIATLIIPFLFLGMIFVQVAVMRRSAGERRVAVVDRTGHLFAPLVKEMARVEASGGRAPRSEAVSDEPGGDRENANRARSIHWVLTERPVGDFDKTKEELRKEVLSKKINSYLILDPAMLAKDEVEYYSSSVSEFVAINQIQRALDHILLR